LPARRLRGRRAPCRPPRAPPALDALAQFGRIQAEFAHFATDQPREMFRPSSAAHVAIVSPVTSTAATLGRTDRSFVGGELAQHEFDRVPTPAAIA